MTVLLLRLAAPLQAWGASSRYVRRETRHEPTKSGVLGLLAAAQGRRRSDPVEDLAALRFGVRVDQPGRLVRDFQTARSLMGKAESMPLSYRYYIADAVFLAAVEGDESLLAGLDATLRTPTFPLYLGRRSCPPAGPVRLGLRDGDLESALRAEPWQAGAHWARQQAPVVDLPLIRDAAAGEVGDLVRDEPISFDPVRREHGWRTVVQARPVTVQNPRSRRPAGVDFMAALGGA